MRIITCTGYYGTGSSAITDLVSEFNDVYSLGEYEFRFLQDPEGIRDLEYNLLENHHRHNSGHALKRFKKNIDFLSGNNLIKKYEPYFDNKFKEISYEYIENLTEFKAKGMWHQDVIDRGKYFYYFERTYNKIYGITRKWFWSEREVGATLLKNEITLYSKPGEKFYEITRAYIEKLFSVANKMNKQNLMIDQLVPPVNITPYLKYFNDIKVIVVDRDPRDIYILEKKYWKGTIVPCENVEDFCKWFKYTREYNNLKEDKRKILRINFEDLIYKYEKTVKEICTFLEFDLNNHLNKKKNFDNDISIKNTRLWEKNCEFQKEIEFIEKNLKEYIYGFE